MRDDSVREALLRALDADADPDAVSLSQAALADWYEERGDQPSAGCLRWVVRNRRRPGYYDRQSTFGKSFWTRQEAQPILPDAQAQLPEKLWLALKGNDEKDPVASYKSYQSPSLAYQALLAAWTGLGEPVADLE